jgi:aryl-alcohol dehydrogenase-like predicted oxidoreductase
MPTGTRATLKGYEWLLKQFQSQETQEKIEKVKQLEPVAAEPGCTFPQLAIAWCLKNPHVSAVITGASKAHQVREQLAALEVADILAEDVMGRIEDVLGNRPEPLSDYR